MHGSVSKALAGAFLSDWQRVAQDFRPAAPGRSKLPETQREGYTLLLAMRSWEFEAFSQLRRV